MMLALACMGGCSAMPDAAVPSRMRQGYTPGFEQRVDRMVRPSQHKTDAVLADAAPDQAAALRGWSQSTFTYPSGAVVAYPTWGVNYEDRPAWLQNDRAYAVISPGILIADVIAMPFWMIVEPGVTEVTYRGVRYPASTTVAPPLPR